MHWNDDLIQNGNSHETETKNKNILDEFCGREDLFMVILIRAEHGILQWGNVGKTKMNKLVKISKIDKQVCRAKQQERKIKHLQKVKVNSAQYKRMHI